MNNKALEKILTSEGGFNPDEPAKVGGKSYAGITQSAYEAWKKNRCKIDDAPDQVEELAGKALGTKYEKSNPLSIPKSHNVRTDVIHAFYTDYFSKSCVDMLPDCLQYIHMDFFTNAGFTANKILQRLIMVDDDGIMGSGSKAKLKEFVADFNERLKTDKHADNELIMEYHDQKLAHYELLKDKNPALYDKNIKGWKMRAQHVLSELTEYFEDAEPTTSAIDETEEIDDNLLFAEENETDEKEQVVSNIKKALEAVLENLGKL